MTDSATHLKFILLRHCLQSANEQEPWLPGGKIILESKGKKACWSFEYDDGLRLPIVEKRALDGYVLGRGQHKRGQHGELPPVDRLNASLCRLLPGLKKYSNAPMTDSLRLSLYDFGAQLGLSRFSCRYVIDCECSANFPVLRALSTTSGKAEKFCAMHAGCYTLYRHDFNSATKRLDHTNGILVRGAISIRYPVPHRPFGSQKKGSCNVKVKLILPSYSQDKLETYEYDGLVGNAGKSWWVWMFQGRFGKYHREMEDMLMMYSVPTVEKQPSMGYMLTQNQDNRQTPTPSTIVMFRESGFRFVGSQESPEDERYSTVPDEDDFMRRTPKAINMDTPDAWDDRGKIAVSHLLSAHKFGAR